MGKTVCVTGAGGFIASWIVLKLLQRGYKVHGTVRDPGNDEKYGHLKKLEGAEERLTLFKADVLDFDSLVPAIRGCDAVFHTACPFVLTGFENPDDVLRPAIAGTENVMRACHEENIKRVVMTSSGGAVLVDPSRAKDKVVDESCWSDPEYCKVNKLWYVQAKVESEKTAWDLSKDYNLDLVVICPVYVFGPLLQSTLNGSTEFLKLMVDGSTQSYVNTCVPMVDVRDVAWAHIMALENKSASGRYFCLERGIYIEGIFATLKIKFPDLKFPSQKIATFALDGVDLDDASWLPPPELYCNKRCEDLIQKFTPYDETLAETITSLQDKGFLPKDS